MLSLKLLALYHFFSDFFSQCSKRKLLNQFYWWLNEANNIQSRRQFVRTPFVELPLVSLPTGFLRLLTCKCCWKRTVKVKHADEFQGHCDIRIPHVEYEARSHFSTPLMTRHSNSQFAIHNSKIHISQPIQSQDKSNPTTKKYDKFEFLFLHFCFIYFLQMNLFSALIKCLELNICA